MDKKEFLSLLGEKHKNTADKLYEKIILSEKYNMTAYSDEFLPPNIWSKLKNIKSKLYINIYTEGVFSESDRRMVCFSPLNRPDNFPITLLKITINSKFHNTKHGDFLGSVLGLGIIREKLGDFVVNGNECYLVICSEMADYIISNLTSVGKAPCSIEEVYYEYEPIPEKKFEIKSLIVSAFRLDNIVASVCNISRSKAVDLIDKGKVLLNYNVEQKKNVSIKINDVITVRGFGKYIINESLGLTSKDRNRISVKKFI